MPGIIVLQGEASTGKSTAIGVLYDEYIKNRHYSIIQDRRKTGSKDFFVIVEKKGKKIGITTYGDSADLIKRKLNYFRDKKCLVFVCAGRDLGPTKDAILRYSPSPLIEVKKQSGITPAEQRVLDVEAAEQLLNEIEAII